ncbi:CoA transferase [Parahaliea maris]|uniref:CoA transferase n=1 Tax=Parahaliea maris TaxID=2716870 RepID=A0A5C8ZZF6_9GAMM|nr:CaiB/BaiF CoA-transferase family protein [Parahaliea maris]TXS92777.1 CoA transferase [Parahaliea maris]
MGPLEGIKIVEISALGPGPMCGMFLADLGAEVTVIQRKGGDSGALIDLVTKGKYAISNRGKRSIALDLKNPVAAEVALDIIRDSDALIEGFRPGVMERLGLGPETCLELNPALIYGRMTGWGQCGPLANCAGHDINYIALSGALYYSGHREEAPFAPPTLVGDVGGGALMLALGIVAGILNARKTGKGQVIDAAITDGTAVMTSLLYSFHQAGVWSNQRGDNIIDSATPWYGTYECADGRYISVGALEARFYNLLMEKCGLANEPGFNNQFDKTRWSRAKGEMASLFKTRTRDQWCELLEGTDACFAPVLDFVEAAAHPHNRHRETFLEIDGVLQPAPAPRFSGTPAEIRSSPPLEGEHTESILSSLGYKEPLIESLRYQGVI